jgi:hypothetical protein
MPRRVIPNARMYQATLPVAIHDALRREAARLAQTGGQVNINKVLVQRLYQSLQADIPLADRKAVEMFVRNL